MNQGASRPIPPGWYADAQGTTRWWDGGRWTSHTRSAPQRPAPGGTVTEDDITQVAVRRRYPMRPGSPARPRPAAPTAARVPPPARPPQPQPQSRWQPQPQSQWQSQPQSQPQWQSPSQARPAPVSPAARSSETVALLRPPAAQQTAVVMPGFGPGSQTLAPSYDEIQRRHRRTVIVVCICAALFALVGMAVVGFSGALTEADGPPTQAEFCADHDRFTQADSTLDAKAVVAEMAPAEDMTPAQSDGFEVFADHVASTPDSSELTDLNTASVPPEDLEAVTSYHGYVETNCL